MSATLSDGTDIIATYGFEKWSIAYNFSVILKNFLWISWSDQTAVLQEYLKYFTYLETH